MSFIDSVHAQSLPSENEGDLATQPLESGSHESAAPVQPGVFGSLGISGSQFVFQLINFAIVVCVVWFLILKPLTKVMTERQKKIDDSLNKAKEIEERMDSANREYAEKMKATAAESNALLAKVHSEAKAQEESLKKQAQAEIAALLAKAQKDILEQREGILNELKNETVKIVTGALEKVLSRRISQEIDKDFIREMLAEMKPYEGKK